MLMLAAGVAALALTTPALAQGRGNDRPAAAQKGEARGKDQRSERRAARTERRARAAERQDRRMERAGERRAAQKTERRMERRAEQRADRREQRVVRQAERRDDRAERAVQRAERRMDRRIDREALRQASRLVVVPAGRDLEPARLAPDLRNARRLRLIDGCPPGLARRGNGCVPPGQLRRIAGYAAPYANWYGYSSLASDAYRWGYHDGYLYRIDPATSLVAGYVPVLGGALFGGHVWPTSYSGYALPAYQTRWYGWGDDYAYRYANGAVFALDPETQAIAAIAGLLTGDVWTVGAPMPVGYDLYNVPLPYRARYYDRPDAWYRYSDGYVYRVDPETLLVLEVIELLV
jgi:hypothetical protein